VVCGQTVVESDGEKQEGKQTEDERKRKEKDSDQQMKGSSVFGKITRSLRPKLEARDRGLHTTSLFPDVTQHPTDRLER